MGLFDSNRDFNTLYDKGGRNDWETDIMEAEWEDCEREMEQRFRKKMGFTDEDEELEGLL